MARCSLGVKKLAKYAKEAGIPAVRGMVRGGNGHRIDLITPDGTVWSYWRHPRKIETLGFRSDPIEKRYPDWAEPVSDKNRKRWDALWQIAEEQYPRR